MVSDKNGKRFIVGAVLGSGSLLCLFFVFGGGNIQRNGNIVEANRKYRWVPPVDKPKTRMDPEKAGGMEGNIQSAFYPFSPHFLQVVRDSEENRLKFIAKRDQVIGGRNLNEINPWEDPIMWNYFPPSISCPSDMVRIGGIGDGGKWICGLREIAKKSRSATRPCVIYSFGVKDDSSFEEELLDTTSCSVFAFDHSVSRMDLNYSKYAEGRVNFFQIGLKSKSSNDLEDGKNYKSLKEIMSERGHDWIDILKMDVEGAEFGGMSQIFKDFPESLPFGHFNVELHFWGDAKDVWKLWTNLEAGGLRAFINEINYLYHVKNTISKLTLIEYGFINVQHAPQVIKKVDDEK